MRLPITLRIPVLAILIAIAAGATYLHWRLAADKSRTIEFGGAIIGGSTAIYALLLNQQGRRASSAAEFIKRWNNPDFGSYRAAVGEVLASNSISTKNLESIRMLLGFFEEISIAILRKEADEALLRDFFWTVGVRLSVAAKPWIDQRRADNHQPTLFVEYEKVYARWQVKGT